MKELAIEGIDGSGKTSTANALSALLEVDGLRAVVVSPHRRAKENLGTDLYELWRHETLGSVAVQELLSTIEECREESKAAKADIIIYDRHWMTAFTECGDNPELVELWGDAFVETALLRVNPEIALSRCQNDIDAAWMSRSEMQRCSETYEQLARQYSNHILGIYRSDDIAPNSIAHSIAWDLRVKR